MRKLVLFLLLPLVVSLFLSVGYYATAQDTAVLSMAGNDWSIKVDSTLQTALDSKAAPYVSVQKAGTEKELFLTLNSLKDCVSGEIQFKIETNGLTVYKQLPLDKEFSIGEQYDFINATHAMLKDKVVVYRPENVVNSFACFDSDGKKVLHIYASKLIDAKGNSVWVDSDLKDGLLTVYLDQKWLDNAVFPVIVDPIFGITNVGGTEAWQAEGSIIYMHATLSEDATLISFNYYDNYGEDGAWFGLIGNGSATVPSKVCVQSNTHSASVDVGWNYVNFTDTSLLAGEYWLAPRTDTTKVLMYDATSEKSGNDEMGDYPNVDSTIVFTANYDRSYSIYVLYEPVVVSTPTPSPSPSPSPTPNGNTATSGNIELSIYVLIIGVLTALAIMTLKLWGGLGIIGGLIGGIFTYLCVTSPNIITNSLYDTTAGAWVYTTYPMGFFAYIPLLFAILNFILAAKKKG